LHADTIRIATFNTELSRKGPGLLLRDIARGDDTQINAVIQIIRHVDPDVIALQKFDYDLTGAALSLFASQAGYQYFFAARPNTGMATGLDMDGDGRLGGPRDAQGYGHFSGQGGMAILSKFPIDTDNVQDLSTLMWRDIPNATLPMVNGKPFPSAEALATQRLSTTGHWIVPIITPDGPFHLLTFHATPPVFDGSEDRNGKCNHDEVRLWQQYLDGKFAEPITAPFVIAGDANLDANAGDGRREAIVNLLNDPRVQDTAPQGNGPFDPTDTVDWSEPTPGDMRVDYVLPSRDWTVVNSGILWPLEGNALLEVAQEASRHRLVWVDLKR
jgi:endonuclease/exonuclease/phosphatase family metal-dependent hydrolase